MTRTALAVESIVFLPLVWLIWEDFRFYAYNQLKECIVLYSELSEVKHFNILNSFELLGNTVVFTTYIGPYTT